MQDLLEVNIKANTYYGARHALETLAQLIGFNDEKNYYMVSQNIYSATCFFWVP